MAYDLIVAAVQRLLAAAGYNPGPLDGLRGPKTEAAASTYLADTAPVAAKIEPVLAWDARSAKSLEGVHPDLVRVAERVRQTSTVPFVILEGLRTLAQQKANVAKGVSQTMDSRHLTGHAIDAAPLKANGQVSWDWPDYYPLAAVFATAAAELGVPLRWGGNWNEDFGRVRSAADAEAMHKRYTGRLPDGPHYELARSRYPA